MNPAAAWGDAVAASFEAAAADYDHRARLQHRVAQFFFDWLTRQVGPLGLRHGLEIGCGTGFLTRRLLAAWPGCHWQITDISPAMVDQCRQRLGPPVDSARVRFDVADGQAVRARPRSLDLIASNLTFQWFSDLTASTSRLMPLLRPGGWLVYSTLGAGTFRSAGELLGQTLHDYPAAPDLFAQLTSAGCNGCVERQEFVETMPGLLELFRHLKGIGAGISVHRPRLTVSRLRQALGRCDDLPDGLSVEYDVLLVAVQQTPIDEIRVVS